ncbi:polymer-forming cytoskeletal protein [Natronomonas sp. LN261]|uniref:polymer-forming cytoskeletal protein n=1 Tax=Natronomonas sp. LN261 TaxID=2750669 RepID=UPI0015EF7F23
MFGSDPLEELVIPDGTHVKEHDLVTDGDVLIGGQSTIELGVRGGSVVAGERVSFGGDIEADGDCRLDMWCEVDGNVLVGDDAYLGERVHITGQLIVSGDLDIGDDVDIDEGFEANGWIVIRNPMPTIVFLFVYLSHLLRIGEEEAAEEVATAAFADDPEAAEPTRIPRGARVSDDAWRVSTPASIGDDCRLHGNIRATDIEVGTETEVFGSLRSKGAIRVGRGTVIHGDVTTRDGDVRIAPGVHVRGDISCGRCELSEAAEVDGTIRANDGIRFEDAPGSVDASSSGEPPESGDPDVESGSIGPDDQVGVRTDGEPPVPAIVPLGEGTLPAPGPEDGDREPISAVSPVAESDLGGENGRATDGDGIAAVIAEAEPNAGVGDDADDTTGDDADDTTGDDADDDTDPTGSGDR